MKQIALSKIESVSTNFSCAIHEIDGCFPNLAVVKVRWVCVSDFWYNGARPKFYIFLGEWAFLNVSPLFQQGVHENE